MNITFINNNIKDDGKSGLLGWDTTREGSSSSANRNGIDNERRNAGDLTSSPDQIYRFSRIFLQESL